MTRRAQGLLDRSPELQVSVNPLDAEKYEIQDGDFLRVSSRRGNLEAKALISDRMNEGEIFVPFVKLKEHAANFLTNAALDPESRIPEYKVCAVKMEKM